MKLKVKNYNWLAGRPVVILHPETAKKIDVFQNFRVKLQNSHSFYSIVDISPKMVKPGEIGLSQEVSKNFKAKEGQLLEVTVAEISPGTKLISKKMSGKKLSYEEYKIIHKEILNNNLTEVEIAYFIASQKLKKLSISEITDLTKAMIDTGKKLNFGSGLIADKHCIGGVAGNRTTPLVVSICAVAGLKIPKTSSRAITSAAGTADTIETISKVNFSVEELKKIVNKSGACLAWGGSLRLAPTDDKIIQVERRVNIDVESQLLASIMSKKMSVGSKYLLIDIPYGKGAKIPTINDAKSLGKSFINLAKNLGIKIKVVYTDGKFPIGNGIGPVLEMMDIIKVLKNKEDAPVDLKNKALFLSSELMKLCGISESEKKAKEILESGKAFNKFKEIINLQNGKDNFDLKVKKLKPAKYSETIKASKSGKIIPLGNQVNHLCRILGTPEAVDCGVYFHKNSGKVKIQEPLITLYSRSPDKIKEAIKYINENNLVNLS